MKYISVSIAIKDGQAVVRIKDNGQGIDPSILPKLFTKSASKSEIGDTGLGLFICKSIIEAHRGRIWAENNHHNKGGAIFSFSLPLANNNNKNCSNSTIVAVAVVALTSCWLCCSTFPIQK